MRSAGVLLFTLAATLPGCLAGSSSHFSKVLKKRSCYDVDFVFAGGSGSSGLGNIGNDLSKGIGAKVSNMMTYSVPSPLTYTQFTANINAGAQLIATHIKNVQAFCPHIKILIGGYSEGAMVVHATAALLTKAERAGVRGVAVFGDPDNALTGTSRSTGLGNTWPINNPSVHGVGAHPSTGTNVYAGCATGDEYCDDGGSAGLSIHHSYATNGMPQQAATFLAALV
ncbi:hypothetical protein RQP46_010465 [Phenoliferia psychrophenolica]